MEYTIDDLILYKDDHQIIINKPSGVLVQSDPSGDWNVNNALEEYIKRPVYLVNRIDRPVSGAVIFALSKMQYQKLIKKWKDKETLKTYIGIVEGSWNTIDQIIEEKLIKGRNHKAIIHPEGKISRMKVSSYPIFDRYSLCMVELSTGRFHQIRALLSHVGYSIKGDVKYGARRKNKDRSIHLHCARLNVPGEIDVIAPINNKDILWEKAEKFLLEKG